MKIPKYIQNKMHRLAKLSSEAGLLSGEIDAYFENRGYNIDSNAPKSLRCGNGCSLEELELGNDVTDEFVNAFERGEFDPYAPCLIGDTVYIICHTTQGWKIVSGIVINLKLEPNPNAESRGLISVQVQTDGLTNPVLYFFYEYFGVQLYSSYEQAENKLKCNLSNN